MFPNPPSPSRSDDQPQRVLDARGPTDRLPIQVRDRQAKEAFRHALIGLCVDVVGPRLSGRSSLIERLAQHCQEAGADPLIVHGVAESLPYDALRAALSARGAGQTGAPVPNVALVQRLADLDPALVIVDDADALDHGSWSALRLAHRSFGTPLVVTATASGPRRGRSVAGFARRHARITLEPLDAEQIHDLLVAYLGGQVSPSLVSRVLVKSGGLAGVACAIARSAFGGGRIRQGDGAWYDAPGLWDDDLTAVYDTLVGDLPADEGDALEILAAVGTIDLVAADQLVGRAILERLEDLDRVRLFTPHGSPLVAVNPPGLADYFAHRPSSVRRMRILDMIAAHAGGPAESAGSERLNAIRSVGVVASDDQLPFVARMFAESGKAQARMALARWTSAPTVASALRVLKLGLSQSSDRNALKPIVVGTALAGCAPRDELTFRYLRARWSMQAAHDLTAVESAFVDDLAPSFEFREALVALQSAFRMERTGIAADDLEELSERVGGTSANGELARISLGFALIHSARPGEALDALVGDYSETSDLVAAHLAVAKGLASCAEGRYEEASEWATKHIDDAVLQGERIALASHAYVAVLAEVGLGRLEKAYSIAKLVFSLDVSSSCLLFDTDKALLNLTAIIALRTGRESAAESFAAHARTLRSGSDAVPFNADGFYDAARQLHRGSAKNAAATQKTLAAELASRGYRFAADYATMLSLSADFDADLASRFRSRGRQLGGDRYVAYLDGQLALQRGDADAILTSGRRLQALGARDEALLLLTHARRLLRGSERAPEAEAIRAEISALLEVGAPAEPSLGHSRIELTSREHELVRLVAAGLSNAEIAGQLHISVRTVDTHLRNIRKKAGASTREDLGLLASAP